MYRVKFIKSTDMNSKVQVKAFKTEEACIAWACKQMDAGNIEVLGYDF